MKLRDRYKRIAESEWFKKAYGGRPLSEILGHETLSELERDLTEARLRQAAEHAYNWLDKHTRNEIVVERDGCAFDVAQNLRDALKEYP